MLIPDEREIWRYLGYHGEKPDSRTLELIAGCAGKLNTVLDLRKLYRRFPLAAVDERTLRIGGVQISSRALAENLKGCREVYLMAATIGLAPDRLSAKAAAAGKVSESAVIQAVGSAMIEAWCDLINEEIREIEKARGCYLRPRFSPGYGDFSIENQILLFRLLDVSKRIGITLSESLMMMPTKSVTAVIGISDSGKDCTMDGCAGCNRKEVCAFRRRLPEGEE